MIFFPRTHDRTAEGYPPTLRPAGSGLVVSNISSRVAGNRPGNTQIARARIRKMHLRIARKVVKVKHSSGVTYSFGAWSKRRAPDISGPDGIARLRRTAPRFACLHHAGATACDDDVILAVALHRFQRHQPREFAGFIIEMDRSARRLWCGPCPCWRGAGIRAPPKTKHRWWI